MVSKSPNLGIALVCDQTLQYITLHQASPLHQSRWRARDVHTSPFKFSVNTGLSPTKRTPDDKFSKNNMDDEIGPSTVTLSEAKGLSRCAARCFAEFTLSATKGLSMTVL